MVNTATGVAGQQSRGYFAFPPRQVFLHDDGDTRREGDSDAFDAKWSQDESARAWDERMQKDEEERRKRLKFEAEIASQGEWDWVRSGGVLRDSQGRRDPVRTESIRREIRLQMEEQRIMHRWEEYEQQWRNLLASDRPLTFRDIPWPLESPPTDVSQLTIAAISQFLLAPLRVRRNTVTQRERIRASLLRWHPDKLASVLRRVVESDLEAVREGVGAVFMCLKALQQEK